jgi:lysophospholipase L1-like esterase
VSSGTPQCKLLFPAASILEVRSASRLTRYTAGVDYTYNAGTQSIEAVGGGTIPTVADTTLAPAGVPTVQENRVYHGLDVLVTYTKSGGTWTGPTTSPSSKLSNVRAKLSAGQPIKIVAYGDSITRGYSASGFADPAFSYVSASPWMPAYAFLVAQRLQEKFGSTITISNPSVGGQDSAWGETNVAALVTAQSPDLVLVAFGANDGAANMTPSTFQGHLNAIRSSVRATLPNCEFIFVGTPLANPAASVSGNQAALSTMAGTVAASDAHSDSVDMGGVYSALIAAKGYYALTGNGTIHPNDYGHRWQAQQILGLLDGF